MPNTYYSTTDDYATGLRWYDRGSFELAAKYWDPLVEADDCDAEYHVGLMYFLGQFKQTNNEEAISLWKKAANGNQQRAQWALGDLYYQKHAVIYHDCRNCDIEKDLVKAYVWYRLFEKSAKYEAEKNQAKYILSKIATDITDEQIREGDKLVIQWKPAPRDCGARNMW